MTKITMLNTASGYNLANINSNFTAIAAALNDSVLWRKNPTGEPNQMVSSNFDLNNNNILNGNVINTKSIIVNGINLTDQVANAAASAAAAAVSATNSANSAAQSQALLNQFNSIWYGALPSDPSTRPNGSAIQIGDAYLNTVSNMIRVYTSIGWIGAITLTDSSIVSYQGLGPNAIIRNVQSRLQEKFSVLDAGVDNTGVTGVSTKVQALVDYLFSLGGGVIRFPRGTYLFDATVNRKQNVFLIGDDWNSVVFKAGGNFPVIASPGSLVNIINGGGVSNVLIRGGGGNNSYGIKNTFTNRATFENIRFHSCYNGMYASNVWQDKWDNLHADGGGTNQNVIGFFMDEVDPANQNNAVLAVNCMAQDCSLYGWRLINFNGSKFTSCEGAGSAVHGWYLGDPVVGTNAIRWGHFINCLADTTSSHGWRLEKGQATTVQQIQFTNCWSGTSTGGSSWYIAGASQIAFTNHLSIAANQSGFYFKDSSRISVNGGVIAGYDTANANNAGITLDNCQFISIDPYMQIYTTTAGPAVSEINGSNLNGNGAWQNPPKKVGIATFYRNVGQEKSGSAVINSGTTSVVVSHGLSNTPSVNDIRLTPRDSMAGAGNYYVNNVNATTFTINSINAPTGNVTIAWGIIPLSTTG